MSDAASVTCFVLNELKSLNAAPDIMAVVAQAVGFEPSGWKPGGYSKTNERYIASLCIP